MMCSTMLVLPNLLNSKNSNYIQEKTTTENTNKLCLIESENMKGKKKNQRTNYSAEMLKCQSIRTAF